MATALTTDNIKLITALDEVTTLADADAFVVQDTVNAKSVHITKSNLINTLYSGIGSVKGRNLQELGGYSSPTATAEAIKAMTSAGNFDQLRLGDYINFTNGLTVDGTSYPWSSSYENLKLRIVGFDHYYRVGANIDVTTHHAVWDWANIVLQHCMNSTKHRRHNTSRSMGLGKYRSAALHELH